MKQNLRVGEGYAPSRNNLKQRYIRYISLLAVLTTMCLYAVKQVSAQQAEPAATADIKPLQIGDTIPEYLWHLPLQVVNHPERKEAITLNEYRGKLIILDFWATWCGSCIIAMAGFHDVQQQFINDMVFIPVSSSEPHDTERLLKSHARLQPLNLSSVVSAEIPAKLFPHVTLPHYAWIDSKGVLIATTGTKDITLANIKKVLTGNTPDYALKTFIDLGGPLLLERDKIPEKGTKMINYTLLIKGQMPSLPFTSRLRRHGDKIYGRAFFNQTIGQLYFGIAKELLGDQFSPNRVIYDIDTNVYPEIDYRRYKEVSETPTLLNTYEFIVTLEKADSLYSLMLANLNTVSGFTGRIESRDTKCLILKQLPGHPQWDFSDKSTETKKMRVKQLVKRLENQPFAKGAVVLNETATNECIQIAFGPETTLSTYNARLEKAGLFIQEETKTIDFFVLSKTKPF